MGGGAPRSMVIATRFGLFLPVSPHFPCIDQQICVGKGTVKPSMSTSMAKQMMKWSA